jgi:hypothetical protein
MSQACCVCGASISEQDSPALCIWCLPDRRANSGSSAASPRPATAPAHEEADVTTPTLTARSLSDVDEATIARIAALANSLPLPASPAGAAVDEDSRTVARIAAVANSAAPPSAGGAP